MNPKLKKITTDIDKTRDKIADLQVKLRELEQQKTEVENTEILALFRSVALTPEELAGFIQRYKAESVAQQAANTAAAPGPELVASGPEPTVEDEKEDADDED